MYLFLEISILNIAALSKSGVEVHASKSSPGSEVQKVPEGLLACSLVFYNVFFPGCVVIRSLTEQPMCTDTAVEYKSVICCPLLFNMNFC